MKLKRKILNIFAAVVMIFGSVPISFTNTFAADDEPTGIVPEEENIPKSLKKVHANNDGTYDITLEIEGVSKQKNDATKANVVVVFDSSGSMNTGATTYSYSESTSGRYRKVDGDYIQLYRRSYGSCSRMDSDSSSTQVYATYNDCVNRTNLFTGTRYTRTTINGTRLTVAKSAVNVLANELLSQNDPSTPGLEDVVEMAFVDFATSVKTDTTHTAPTTDLDTFKGWVNATNYGGGTNWEAALTTAKSISFGDDDKTYIIFVSDGNPTFRDSKYNSNATDNCYTDGWTTVCDEVWGNGKNDNNGWNFGAAKDVADEIIGTENVEFYTVGAFGDATNMQNLGGTYYNATNQDALEEAFAEIVDKIKMGLSVADLQIEDGITPATSTEVDGTAGNFRYDVPDSWGDDWGKASFEGGSVHWNPGEHKTLSNGEKASVTFTVWPSQEAMDCIASIRNDGTCDESDLTKFGLGVNSDGSFRLITNNTATFRFKTATKNEDTGETTYSDISIPIDFSEERDQTNLPETTLDVVKVWLDSMDAHQRDDISDVAVDLFVDRGENSDPERHYTFTKAAESGNEWAGEDENGKSEYTVAPGVMKKLDGTPETEGLRGLGPVVKVGDDEYVVLEAGHDYEFDNEQLSLAEGGSNHYHITKRKYHPMIIGEGGNIHDVVFSEDGKTATIEDGVLTKLSLENTLNGGILVGKTVVNNDEEDKTIEDEYEITITLSEETGTYRIYTYNPDGTVKERSDKKTYTGGVINEKITVNQKIRVQDVPTGTTYEVTEVLPDGYTRNKVDYTVVMYDGTEDKDGVQEVFGNASAQATVTNYLESGDLIIKKTVMVSSGDLKQAQNQEFSFTVNFYKSQDKTELMRTDTETCKAVKHNETCEIKNIPKGWYYEIVEAAKPGFNNGDETTKTGTIKKGDNEETFINDYAVTPLNPDDAKILVDKAFASGYEPFWIAADSFTFVMTGNGKTVESTPLTLSGRTAEFVPKITDAGTYTYTITEKTTDGTGKSLFREGVSRFDNDEDIIVTIVARDKGDGTLELVSKTYSKESKTIYNKYEGDNTYGGKSGELEFTKNLTGRDWQSSDKFNFTIASQDKDAPMPERTTITADKDHKTVGFGKIKFTNKDVGNTYTYTVTESFDVPSVEATGTSAGGISLTIAVSYNTTTGKIDLTVSNYEDTFTNEYKTTNVTAAKKWDDDNNRDGLRKNYNGYYVAVKNDEGKFVAYEKLALEDKNDYEFTDLPEKNAEGAVINYEIVEASTCSGSGESIQCTEFEKDENYTATVDGYTITNFHEPALYNDDGDLTVQKIWAGEGNDLVRPNTVTIELYANGSRLGEPVTISAANEWKHTFKNLYLNEGGKPIVYTVQESKLGETAFGEDESVIVIVSDDGISEGTWTKSENNDKHEVTNTWNRSAAKSLTIKKTVEGLSADVLSNLEFTITGPEDFGDNGKMTLKASKDCTTAGKVITCKVDGKVPTGKYTVKESNAEVENFTLTVTGDDGATKKVAKDDEVEFAITNSYEKIRDVHYKVKKIWDDNDDQDGVRPDKLTITLMRKGSGKAEEYRTVELTDDKLEHEWTNLPRADENAVVYTYSVVEEEISDYESDGGKMVGDTFIFTNKHEPELINEEDDDPDNDGKITVQKVWTGEGNELARPNAITVDLYANGKRLGVPVTLTAAGGWKHTFEGLYKNENGKPIVYSVEESKLGETAFGESQSTIVVYSSDDTISGSWTKSVNGHEITNTWKEATDEIIYDGANRFYIKKVDEEYQPLEGVTFSVNGADKITDAKGMASKSVPVSKNQKEESFEFAISEKATLEGYDLVEGSATVTVTCTSVLAETDASTLTNTYVKNCGFKKSGSEKYVWDDASKTLTVVNNRSLAKSLRIRKTTVGLKAEVLKDLEFTITGPEDFGDEGEMTLKVGEGCKASGYEITCEVDGKVPTGTYTVMENNAEIDGFTLTVSGDDGVEKKVDKDDEVVFEIKNTYEVDEVMYFVDKIWEDAHDKDGKRPEELVINLLANGEVVDTIVMTMKDVYILGDDFEDDYVTGDIWGYVWENLPYMDEDAEPISYTVEEVLESEDYEQVWAGGDEYATTFVNYHELEDDPCAEGGCGGFDVIPTIPTTVPNTGRLSLKNNRNSSAEETGFIEYTIGTCALVVLGIIIFVVEKKNYVRK